MSAVAVDLPVPCMSCDEAPALRRAIGTRSLAGRILRAQEEERARVARELHDDTGQSLTLVLVRLATLRSRVPDDAVRREIDAVSELASETLDGVRRLATDLGPTVLRDLGLASALDVLAARVGREAGLSVDVRIRSMAPMSEGSALALYRVAQEALTNIVRHARATSASLQLDRVGTGTRLVIEDDGLGFDVPNEFGNLTIGLYGMRERLELVDGRLEISSRPGYGSRVAAVVPGPLP